MRDPFVVDHAAGVIGPHPPRAIAEPFPACKSSRSQGPRAHPSKNQDSCPDRSCLPVCWRPRAAMRHAMPLYRRLDQTQPAILRVETIVQRRGSSCMTEEVPPRNSRGRYRSDGFNGNSITTFPLDEFGAVAPRPFPSHRHPGSGKAAF